MSAWINLLSNCSHGNIGDGSKMTANRLYDNAMAAKARRVPVPKVGEVVSLLEK